MLTAASSAELSVVDVDGSPQVVIAVHQPLLAGALAHVLRRGLAQEEAVEVITLDREPDSEAVYVLRLPETLGDPAVLESPGGSVSLVLWSLQDVTDLVRDLLTREAASGPAGAPFWHTGQRTSTGSPLTRRTRRLP